MLLLIIQSASLLFLFELGVLENGTLALVLQTWNDAKGPFNEKVERGAAMDPVLSRWHYVFSDNPWKAWDLGVDMKFQINLLNKKAPVNPGPHPYYCGRSHMHREKSTAPRDFLGWSSYREYRHACQGTTRERNTGWTPNENLCLMNNSKFAFGKTSNFISGIFNVNFIEVEHKY